MKTHFIQYNHKEFSPQKPNISVINSHTLDHKSITKDHNTAHRLFNSISTNSCQTNITSYYLHKSKSEQVLKMKKIETLIKPKKIENVEPKFETGNLIVGMKLPHKFIKFSINDIIKARKPANAGKDILLLNLISI